MTEATEQQWTIKRLLEWTTDYFKTVNPDSPRLDAEVLLGEVLGCQRVMLYTQFDRVPEENLLARFREAVKRRGAGEPVAYIVGHWEFYSLDFEVNSHVLIPRPETEHLVVAALDAAKQIADRPIRVLDIGTGSGCIAIALAKHLDDCRIGAIDVSAAALEVAARNVAKHQLDDRIRLMQGDLFAALPTGSAPVDLIVSNPPYIGTAEVDTVDPSVRKYEPDQALFAGNDGMQIIDRLVQQATNWLKPGGFLIFEISPFIVDQCMAHFRSDSTESTDSTDAEANPSPWAHVNLIKDLAGNQRVIVARRK
jgi:release factor glutamine methyltransferase